MKIYTYGDWLKDGTISPKIGQYVSDKIVYDLRDCVPPAYMGGGLFQVGEPYALDKETQADLYMTFGKDTEQNKWRFLGYCLLGKTENRVIAY